MGTVDGRNLFPWKSKPKQRIVVRSLVFRFPGNTFGRSYPNKWQIKIYKDPRNMFSCPGDEPTFWKGLPQCTRPSARKVSRTSPVGFNPFEKYYTTWKGSMAIATPISLGLSWPLTNCYLLGVAIISIVIFHHSQIGSFPQVGENKRCFKPPPGSASIFYPIRSDMFVSYVTESAVTLSETNSKST